jgi:hypothetical protein
MWVVISQIYVSVHYGHLEEVEASCTFPLSYGSDPARWVVKFAEFNMVAFMCSTVRLCFQSGALWFLCFRTSARVLSNPSEQSSESDILIATKSPAHSSSKFLKREVYTYTAS